MSNSLIVKWKYKGNIRDYMTLKQFETYITTGQQPSQTWWDADKKYLAIKKKKNKL